MLSITHLTELTFENFIIPGHYGYVSNGIYKVKKFSDRESISFNFKSEKTDVPYVKTWKLTDENINHCKKIIAEGFSFGAYKENELIGVILCETRKWNNTLYIENLFVSESHRRKGTGKLLIKKVIEISRQKNFRHIELETQNTNVPAIEFYKKQGFEITGMNMTLYDPLENKDEVALFMVYDLIQKHS